MSKAILKLALLFTYFGLFSQGPIQNLDVFSKFYYQGSKNLLIVGENHSSSVGPLLLPELIEYHHKNDSLNSLLIEFGPSEAYFYNKYLETGNEKYLRYTIYGGFYKDWTDAWKKLYLINVRYTKPIKVYGVDFDRTRTFGYALYNIFKEYDEKPPQLDSLMNDIKDEKFFKTYSIGHPTETGKKFVESAKEILNNNMPWIKKAVNKDDVESINFMLDNQVKDFDDQREKQMYQNINTLIMASSDKNFLLMVGRDHAYKKAIYDDKKRVATWLKSKSGFSTYTGVILHENSKQRGVKEDEIINLFEVKNKIPWKEYNSIIQNKAKENITIIPLEGKLSELKKYVDYVIVARNQRELKIK